MKVKTDWLPKKVNYLTESKIYEVLDVRNDGNITYGDIIADDGDLLNIVIKGCAFLDGRNWTIVEE